MVARLFLILVATLAMAIWPRISGGFPLTISPDGRFLVDAPNDALFVIQGDAAWSLIAQLRREDVDLYLADRHERGFNTILVSLIEHRFASNAPANIYRQRPFFKDGDFTLPNEAYFAHADWVLRRAAEYHFLVLLAPCYAGVNGGDEGWYQEMVAAGPEKLRQYGEYLGNRYRDFDNIIWVQGGDYDPPDKSLVRAIADGIRYQSRRALQTAQGGPESTTLDYWKSEGWVALNAIYTYLPVYRKIEEQPRVPALPFFLIESAYENEHGATPQRVRMQAYQALLLGAAGQVYGNNPIWHFDGPGLYRTAARWVAALDSGGARSITHLRSLIDRLDWRRAVPDVGESLLVEGFGPPTQRAVAARADDGSFAVAYVPTRRAVVIDLGYLSKGRIVARWYDPSAGVFEDAAVISPTERGRHRFKPMTKPNAAGDDDWVLVLEARP